MLECSLWKNLLDLWSETRLGQRDVVVYLLLLLWLVPCGLQRGEKGDSRWERSFPAHTAKLGEPWSLLAGVGPSTDNTFLLLSSVVAQQEKILPPRPSLLEAGSDGSEEPKQQVSWEQEFLVGNSPGGSGRALCMVCGAEIQAPSADTARAHILEQHPHTLDLSPSEKSNILEAWSEGAALVQDFRAEQPSPHHSDSGQDSDLDPARMPAEIVVLLDSEDNPSLPRRTRPRGLRPLELPAAPVPEPVSKKPRGQRCKEPSGEEPVRKKRGRPMTKTLDLDPDPDPDPPSPDSPMETFAAPAEVRHFTDGSFPAGFALQLFSHTQLRASNRRDLPKEGRGVEGGCLQPESPSPGPRSASTRVFPGPLRVVSGPLLYIADLSHWLVGLLVSF
ncbi:PREDICTED: uncharacterized protein C11orf84 homolog isoform X2 [Capra hircus]|uniref:uncharacterized protein C11orf84 homolog isoform X2 n=1 Tax=Capra hircus TaxID=9925 RepID=UPI000846C56B|nr:PREDICTED: uncharacterized protein C11orf84 homolog isoform X2 [Capra hircus]